MDCQNCRHELENLRAGDAAGAATQAHLESCARCHALHVEQAALKRLLRELAPVTAPPDFDFRLRARMASGMAATSSRPRRFAFAPGALSLGFAAAFVCAVLLAQHWPDSRVVESRPNQPTLAATAPTTLNARMETPGVIEPSAVREKKPLRVDSGNGQELALAKATNRLLKASTSPTPRRQMLAIAEEVSESTPALVAATKNEERGEVTSSDLGVKGASAVLSAGGLAPRATSFASMTFAVQGATAPLRVIWRGAEGAIRSAAIAPVGFGAQDLPSGGRSNSNMPRHTPASDQGVW